MRGDEPSILSVPAHISRFSRMRGDEPDRHAYILDLVKLLYICPVPDFGACPRRQHLSRRWLFIIDCIT